MPNIVSNPLFQVILLFIVTTIIWFLVNDETTILKKKVLTFMTDGLYYFVLATFGLNFLINFREIIREPYQILLFSSEISWIALILVMIYLGFRERKKITSFTPSHEQLVSQLLNFFMLLGLFNHLFYYYKYRRVNSVIFIVIYFTLYFFKDRIKLPRINEWILLTLAFLHAIVMSFFSNIIIYFQIVFYPYQIISLFIIASLLLIYFRRKSTSKQK